MMQKRGCKGSMRNKILMSGNIDMVDMEKADKMGSRVFQKPIRLKVVDEILLEIENSLPVKEQLMAV